MVSHRLYLLLTAWICCSLVIPSTGAQSCGGVLNQTEGEILSPDYPAQPGSNLTCVWYVVKTDRYAIFHVDELELSGAQASLQIYSGNATAAEGSDNIVANFTANSESRPVITSDNVTTVILHTGDWAIQNKTARVKLPYSISSACQQNLTAWSVKVKSPLFSPGALPLKCFYDIKGKDSTKNFTLSFEEFHLPKGRVIVKYENETLGNFSGTDFPNDVFTKADNLQLEFTPVASDKETFTVVINTIHPDCLLNITLKDWGVPVALQLPADAQYPVTCQWQLHVPDNHTVRVNLDQSSVVSSRVVVSDGPSLFGSRRRQTLGLAQTGNSFVSSGDSVSVYLSLDPSLITEDVHITATPQKYGGVFKHNASLEGHEVNSDGSSQWYYYLVSPSKQKVRFEITNSSLYPATTIRCYDGATELSPLVADFRSDRPFYPVVSTGSDLLVVASNLEYRGFFTAQFSEVADNCDQISHGYQGHYSVKVSPAGSEVATCTWIIQPIDEEGVLLVKVSTSGFLQADNLTMYDGLSEYNINVLLARGDKSGSSVDFPVVAIPAQTGARLSFSAAATNGSVTILRTVRGDYSFTSDKLCGGSLTPGKEGSLLSPYYPNDRYPLNIRCDWTTTINHGKLLYVMFDTLDIDPGHSVNIYQYDNSTAGDDSKMAFNGSVLPNDLILQGPNVSVTFTTEESHQGGNSGRGFNISYRTLDLGGKLTKRKGGLTTPGFPTSVSSTIECIWIIEVPPKGDNSSSVPIVSFDIELESFSSVSRNNMLEFRDGNSQRAPASDLKLTNGKTKGFYSRTNQLWVRYFYQLHDSDRNAPGFAFRMTYTTYDCPKSQQCDNRVCMQQDWKCDGIDQCGDESDERGCASTVTTTTGVKGFIVALLVIMGVVIGVIAAFLVPAVYKRIRYPNYRHLRDIVSPIDT